MKVIPVLHRLCCGPSASPMPREEAERLAATFKALADPTRVAIVNRLSTGTDVCVCDLTDAFALSQPTISHHLGVLRAAGLIEGEKKGTWSYYRLVPGAVERIRDALAATPE